MWANKPGREIIGSAEEVVGNFIARMKTESFLKLGRIGQKFARRADTTDELELLDIYMEMSQAKEEHQSWVSL